jgi:hypothetical protein
VQYGLDEYIYLGVSIRGRIRWIMGSCIAIQVLKASIARLVYMLLRRTSIKINENLHVKHSSL